MLLPLIGRNDKRIDRPPPYPSPSWGEYLATPLPKLRGNRQNAPSPDWGRLGWGVSRKGIFLVVILKSGAERSVIQNPLRVQSDNPSL